LKKEEVSNLEYFHIFESHHRKRKRKFIINEKRLSMKERFGPPSIVIPLLFLHVDKALEKTVKKVEDILAIFKV
jgi:hypothetical protein